MAFWFAISFAFKNSTFLKGKLFINYSLQDGDVNIEETLWVIKLSYQ